MSLKKYLTEAELAAVQPITGDEFDISIRELANIETVVLEHTEGSITIALDETAMKMLEHCGCTFEDEDEEVDYEESISEQEEEHHYDSDEYKESLNDIRRLSGMKIDELSPAAKQAWVDKVTDKGGWFSGPKPGSLAGMKNDMDTVSNYMKKGPEERNYSPRWKKLHKDIQTKYDRRALNVNKVQGQLARMGESEFDTSSGSPYDRGAADSYYGRDPRPHKIVPYTGADAVKGQMQKVPLTDPAEIAAYEAGYRENDDRKDYGFDESLSGKGKWVHSAADLAKSIGLLLGIPMYSAGAVMGLMAEKGVEVVEKTPLGQAIIQQVKQGDPAASNDFKTLNNEIKKMGVEFSPSSLKSLEALSDKYLHEGKLHENAEYQMLKAELMEAEYQGRKVQLGKPMQGDVKKFKVYVKDPKTGNVKKVNFGDPNMRIKKSNPARRKSFRARHNCDNPGPRTKARYWSCRKW